MDTIDLLFEEVERNSNDCLIVEDEIEIINLSNSENYNKENIYSQNTLVLKIENVGDTNYTCRKNSSPPLFESENNTFSSEIENNVMATQNIEKSGWQSSFVNYRLCAQQSQYVGEIEFLDDTNSCNTDRSMEHQKENTINEIFSQPGTNLPDDISNDINKIDESLTKSGHERTRKKFIYNKRERLNYSKNKRRNEHQLKPPCALSCRKLCTIKITNACRQKINDMFWSLSWTQQGNFLKSMSSKKNVSRNTVDNSKRQFTINYSLHDHNEEIQNVCQTFFLATLGYKKNNNTILKRIHFEKNTCTVEKRGKHFRDPAYKEHIKQHIELFNPTISHYRRKHAPNKRYLPSDVTVKKMYNSFHELNQSIKCSYDTYRNLVKELNISFSMLGNEECEKCAVYNLVEKEHINCNTTCTICVNYNAHKARSVKSRQIYDLCKNIPWSNDEICLSADLQKVIMLPRMDMFKQILFTKRIIAFNESFVPVGKWNKNKKPMAVVWHEAITGRNKEDLISSFLKCLLYYRDAKKIKLWLDNCSSQNKNWTLFSFFVTIINSSSIDAEEIELYYFEPGHTYMSADSFHHQVELSLKKQKKTYDFNDFVDAVRNANKSNTVVQVMTENDFYVWKDNSSQSKIKKSSPRALLKNMVRVKFKKNNRHLYYSVEYDGDNYFKLSFLKNSVEHSALVLPEAKCRPTGISAKHHDKIINDIIPLLPKNRQSFWMNLPILDPPLIDKD